MPEPGKALPNVPASPSRPIKPRRPLWRRLLRWSLYAFLVLAVFHRPVVLTVARVALKMVAAKQNVDLDVHFSGTIFTNLTIKDLKALPNGKGKTPVGKIEIERIALEYSLPNLIRHGVGEFLRSYQVLNADLVFVGDGSKKPEDTEQKKSLAETLNSLLGQPALYADSVRIENFNITVKSPSDVTEVKGIHLILHPWEPGYLRIAKLSVPGLPVWENLSAETSYAKRNLFIKGLRITPDLTLERLNFDASQRSENKGSLQLAASIYGGHLEFDLAGTKLNEKGQNLDKAYDTALKIDARGINVPALLKYFSPNTPPPPVSTLTSLQVEFAGDPERPRKWKGHLDLRAEGFSFGTTKLDYVQLKTAFADGVARIGEAKVASGATNLALIGQAQLPDSINDFSKTEADATFTLSAPSLEEATKPLLPQPIAGAITGGGKLGLHMRMAAADVEINASEVKNPDLGVQTATVKLHATKALDTPPEAGAMAGLEGKVSAEVRGISYQTFSTDSATLAAVVHNDVVQLEKLEVLRGENSVSAKGRYQVPQPGQPAPPIAGEFAIRAPKLNEFGLGKDEQILGGHLNADGKVEMVGTEYTGGVTLDGGDFSYGGFGVARLTGKIDVAKNEANLDQLTVQINKTDQIALTGKVGVQAPYTFEGAVLVLFQDLGVLQPLLETFGVKEKLAGKLDVSVESQGKLRPLEPSGQVKVSLTKMKYGTLGIDDFELAGLFGANYAETSQLHVAMGETTFDGGLEWRDDRLRLKDINLRQGSQQALTGFALLPFEPKNPAGPLPLEKRVAVNVNANQLDIEKLLGSLGQTAPASGKISANLVVGGSLLEPTLHLKVSGRELKAKAPAAAGLKPAEFDLTAHFSNKDLTLDTVARLPDVQPLTIKGHVPLDLQAIQTEKKLDPQTPLEVMVKLPPSSLAFVSKMVPAVRSLAGTAAIDAHVSGTVEKPLWGGSVLVKVDYARLKNEAVPSIGKLDVNLGFSQEALVFNRLRGDIGGGTFDLGGKVGLAKLTEPVFDLHLKSNSVLVKRDDSITVRVDSDITVAGPLAAGKVGGTVWVTQSRFFKDIDILPIALPGRPKPKPEPRSAPSGGGGGGISLPPPLSGWTFDLAIKTRPNDPFKIIGNLANGAASIDLKFGGTGAKPWLEGQVQIDKLAASLPFSKLEINRGFVNFGRDEFLEPKLEIYAESQLRDYHINIFIYGSAKDPQLSMTSEPPLAQADLISLIATGSTTAELTGSSDVLASRAAILLFQQVYHKIFKKRAPTENKDASAFDRFSFDAGAADSKTGRQEIAASFKITDQIYLVGDVDVTGVFTGTVKYLLRFR